MESKIYKLVHLFLSGRFSPETERRVQQWLIHNSHTEEKEAASFEWWNQLKVRPSRQVYTALAKVNQRIGRSTTSKPVIRLRANYLRIAAVLLLLLISGSGYIYLSHTRNTYSEITVAHGNQQYVLLPDGSEVWLNSGTTLRYPRKFKGSKREVVLKGEAYFAVKKADGKTFAVQTEHLTVNVLGTAFNLKAYPGDEQTIATLASGKVAIRTEYGQSHTLTPGEQLVFDNQRAEATIRQQQPEEATGWKKGHLFFTDATLTEILRTLERRFGLTVETAFSEPGERYTIKFTRNESPAQIIDILNEMSDYTIRLHGKTIIISRE